MRIKTTIYLALAVIMAAGVVAVGVAPGTIRVPYSQEQQTARFIVVNNQDAPARIVISIAGELAGSVSLAEDSLDMAPREERELSLAVMLQSLVPGEHSAQIIISEVPKGQQQGTGISAAGGVISRLVVEVPYPDKYITAGMKADDRAIVVQVTNKGSIDIASSRADLTVTGRDSSSFLMKTDDKPVKVGETRELVAYHALLPGEYDVDAVVRYDSLLIQSSLGFEVGYPELAVADYAIERREGISRLSLDLESNWNAPIDVYADSLIQNEKVTSPTVTVPARGQARLDLFFASETEFVKVVLHYRGRSVEKEFALAEKEAPSEVAAPLLLVPAIVLVIIALAILLWRMHARRR